MVNKIKIDRNCATTYVDQLASQIRNFILSGELKIGYRLLPAIKLSKKLGLAYKTVEKAINKLVSEGFIERKKKRGTFVRNYHQKADKKIKHGKIIVLLPESGRINYPYTARVIEGIRDMANRTGLEILVKDVDEYRNQKKDWWEEITKESGIKGVIIDKEGVLTAEVYRFIDREHVPAILLNSLFFLILV